MKYSEESIRVFLKIGLTVDASQVATQAAEFERRYGSLTQAEKMNAKALGWMRGKEQGEAYLTTVFEQLLIEHARSPSKKVLSKLVRLHESATKKGSHQRPEIAIELARVAEELGLHADALRWNKIVQGGEVKQ